jgi:hypothetical protein
LKHVKNASDFTSYQLPPASAGGRLCLPWLQPKYKKAALIQIALAEALRNYASSVFG